MESKGSTAMPPRNTVDDSNKAGKRSEAPGKCSRCKDLVDQLQSQQKEVGNIMPVERYQMMSHQLRDRAAAFAILQEELDSMHRENMAKDEVVRALSRRVKEQQQSHMLQVCRVPCQGLT